MSLDLAPIKARLAAATASTPYELQGPHRVPARAWSDLYQHAPSDIRDLIAEVERLREETP
ncbi:hypothetical protein NSA19_02765 [Actinomyces bowdenii]|uniref:hypothetical protein n=1 Tax=Actinomyces bowdenii TaxID=131109 RepID=UPI00214AA8E2|nr:hypothetical protein [Actinomyces bowdenii]MCR2051791.1 hypothetical protein [Actinomyces bowdenii]